MGDHVPGLAGAVNTPKCLAADKGSKSKGKGNGKDKNGEPQVCFAWRNTGVCPKKDAGTCNYSNPKDVKGTGKPSSKKGWKGGKGIAAPNSSRTSKGGAGGGKGSGSPRGKKVATDVALLSKNFPKGKCANGDKCKYHHNGTCICHQKGNCKNGDGCVFSHHIAAAAATVEPPKKKKDDNA